MEIFETQSWSRFYDFPDGFTAKIRIPCPEKTQTYILLTSYTLDGAIVNEDPITINFCDEHYHRIRSIYFNFSGDRELWYYKSGLRKGTAVPDAKVKCVWIPIESLGMKVNDFIIDSLEKRRALEILQEKVQVLEELVDQPDGAGCKFSYEQIQNVLK